MIRALMLLAAIHRTGRSRPRAGHRYDVSIRFSASQVKTYEDPDPDSLDAAEMRRGMERADLEWVWRTPNHCPATGRVEARPHTLTATRT